jgi:hypothetical protein
VHVNDSFLVVMWHVLTRCLRNSWALCCVRGLILCPRNSQAVESSVAKESNRIRAIDGVPAGDSSDA